MKVGLFVLTFCRLLSVHYLRAALAAEWADLPVKPQAQPLPTEWETSKQSTEPSGGEMLQLGQVSGYSELQSFLTDSSLLGSATTGSP